MSITNQNAHKSKYGYHPVSYEDYLKLKKAHKILFKAVRDIRNYHRWERKLNPKYDEPFHPKIYAKYVYKMRKGGLHYILDLPQRLFKDRDGTNKSGSYYDMVLMWYQDARRPVKSVEELRTDIDMGFVNNIIDHEEEFYS